MIHIYILYVYYKYIQIVIIILLKFLITRNIYHRDIYRSNIDDDNLKNKEKEQEKLKKILTVFLTKDCTGMNEKKLFFILDSSLIFFIFSSFLSSKQDFNSIYMYCVYVYVQN